MKEFRIIQLFLHKSHWKIQERVKNVPGAHSQKNVLAALSMETKVHRMQQTPTHSHHSNRVFVLYCNLTDLSFSASMYWTKQTTKRTAHSHMALLDRWCSMHQHQRIAWAGIGSATCATIIRVYAQHVRTFSWWLCAPVTFLTPFFRFLWNKLISLHKCMITHIFCSFSPPIL